MVYIPPSVSFCSWTNNQKATNIMVMQIHNTKCFLFPFIRCLIATMYVMFENHAKEYIFVNISGNMKQNQPKNKSKKPSP